MFNILRKTGVCVGLVFGFYLPNTASAFSLGIRAGGGAETNSVSAPLFLTAEGEKLTNGIETSRMFISYGADVVVTPVTFGPMSVSTLLGVRLTSTKATGDFNDELSLIYLPIGASFDYLLGRLRFSGYASFDLGLSAKLKITVPSTSQSVEPKLSSLSRIRFGAFGEYFLLPALSIYGQADYGLGGSKSAAGDKTVGFVLPSGPEPTQAELLARENKLKGLTFGGGVAYYFPPPKSGAASPSGKAAPVKRPTKGTVPGAGKKPPVRPKPKPAMPPAAAPGGSGSGF